MRHFPRQFVGAIIVVALLFGCDRAAEPIVEQTPIRVVSLAPAITQMLVKLGCGRQVVGVGQNDASAPSSARVVGHFMDVNAEAVVSLDPTHVVGMFGDLGADIRLASLAGSEAFALVSYPYPRTVAGVLRILRTPKNGPVVGGTPPLGELLGLAGEARRVANNIEQELSVVVAATRGRRRPKVLMLFDVETMMAVGSRTVLHDLLTRYAGGLNAAGGATVSAPTFDREKLAAADPEVIVLLTPGRPPFGSLADDPRLGVLRGLSVSAVRHGRVEQIRDPFILLPSTEIARTAALIARAIHGPLPKLDKVFDQTGGGR